MYRVISFGEILWDNLPTDRLPGGVPMNIALHMNTLGHKAALISRVGNDEAGKGLLNHLKTLNAVTDFIQIDNTLETGSVDVIVGGEEGQFYRVKEPAAWDNIQINDEIVAAVRNSKMFVFGTLAARVETSKNTLFELLEEANTKVFSVNIRPPYFTWNLVEELMRKSDLVKLNKTELSELLHWCGKGHYLEKEGLEYLRNKFDLDTILVSLGRRGAIMNRRGEHYQRDGVDIEVVDKVGCGNAFLAAYLHARVHKMEPEERLDYAIASGAMAATHAGAANHINSEMLEAFIDQNVKV